MLPDVCERPWQNVNILVPDGQMEPIVSQSRKTSAETDRTAPRPNGERLAVVLEGFGMEGWLEEGGGMRFSFLGDVGNRDVSPCS